MPQKYHGGLVKILAKWAFAALLLAIVIFNVGNWVIYSKSKTVLENELGKRQSFLASVIAEGVRTSEMRALSEDPNSVFAGILKDKIDGLRKRGGFTSINLLDTTGAVLYSSGGLFAIGERFPYIPADKIAFLSAISGIPAATELYKAGGIYLRGAYAPIVDELGDVGWIINIEAGAEFFGILSLMRRSIVIFLAISVIVAIVCGAVLIRAGIEISRMEKALVNASTFASIGEMASGLGQEVRNPLAIIKASAESLKTADENKKAKLVEFISEEGARIDETLDGYLTFARPAGQKKNIFLGEIAEDIAEKLKDKLSIKNLKIKSERNEEEPILANENGIRRAILNVLLNAIEASPEGREISILSRSKELVVSDRGQGIPHKKIKSVFEPFYTTKPDGTGLGLTITKQIVENEGGQIEIESTKGGTRIKMEFNRGLNLA